MAVQAGWVQRGKDLMDIRTLGPGRHMALRWPQEKQANLKEKS